MADAFGQREDSQLGQFRIGSFFFLTALVAMFFGEVRWSSSRIVSHHHVTEADSTLLFVVVTVAWLFSIGVSFPFILGMAEAVLWTSVWALRQPIVHRAIRTVWFTRQRRRQDATAEPGQTAITLQQCERH